MPGRMSGVPYTASPPGISVSAWSRAARWGSTRSASCDQSRADALPGVDVRPLLVRERWPPLGAEQAGGDPASRIGGIDHLVDLEVGRGAECLAARVGVRHHLVEQGAALGRIGDGLELLAVAELDRALQPHAAE